MSPVVDAHRGEVQLVLGLEDECFGPDLQDGWSLDRDSDAEQGELRLDPRAVLAHHALAMEVLQSPLEFQSLERRRRRGERISVKGGSSSSDPVWTLSLLLGCI